MIPTLHTDRLTLRAPRADDLDAFATFCASERTALLGGPYNRAQSFDRLCSLVGHWQLRGFGRWMVADRATDEPLGVVGLLFPEGWPEPEIAWSVFGKAEGRGIAYEAALGARSYAYDTLDWSTAISLIDPTNTRSVALARRMGCTDGKTWQHPNGTLLDIWRHPEPEAQQ